MSPTPLGVNGVSVAPLPPFRQSLLSLLADFIDSSCNELRADLLDIVSVPVSGSGGSCDTDSDHSGDGNSDGSYEMCALSLDEDVIVVNPPSPLPPLSPLHLEHTERYHRITASIQTHLGWMKDLRGEKPPLPPSAVRASVPTDVGSETDVTEGPVGERKEKEEENGEENGENEEENENWKDVKDANVGKDERDGHQEDAKEEEVPNNNHNDGLGEEPEIIPEIKAEKEEEKDKEEEEGGREGVAPSGVRLALLPDFRSKILWLAALVDVEGVAVIISDELHVRLKEIVAATSLPPLPSALPSSIPSSTSSSTPSSSSFMPISPSHPSSRFPPSPSRVFCDVFCSSIVKGVRSAAAPLSEVRKSEIITK